MMFLHLPHSSFVTALLVTAILATASGCSPEKPDAQRIIDRAIEVHGGTAYQSTAISFVFRDSRFLVQQAAGSYRYERARRDSTGLWLDVLTPNDFDRTVNGVRVALSERDSLSGSSTLNSVPYFALLPYRLNDPAARKQVLDVAEVGGEPYHKVEVTFAEGGGGRDWQDRFVYWIHRERYTMDFLAYRYGSGSRDTRFRQAVAVREVGGIRFADYRNFVLDSLDFDIADYDRLFEEGRLEHVSDVELDSIEVKPMEG